MQIKPIRSKSDYRATLKEVEGLMGARAGTVEGDRLDVLVTLIEAYEVQHYPMDLPDAVEAIRFTMEQRGLTVIDLVPAIGQRNRVYEVLNRQRPLTLRMIRALHDRFGIPFDALLKAG